MTVQDEKETALRAVYALHPHPAAVSDPLFAAGHPFFDPRDLVQVRYEMLRHVRVDGHAVTRAAAAAGCSRSAFYAAQRRWATSGLAGLLPNRPGPHGAHKLTAEVLACIDHLRLEQPGCSAAVLVPLLQARSGLLVHRRSIERACARASLLPADPARGSSAAVDLANAYETLRAWATGAPNVAAPPGLALLIRRGVSAWLAAWRTWSPPTGSTGPPRAIPQAHVPVAKGSQVVVLLTNMVLSCQREGSA